MIMHILFYLWGACWVATMLMWSVGLDVDFTIQKIDLIRYLMTFMVGFLFFGIGALLQQQQKSKT